ncbi:hypothetical protein TWF281_010564 [Arthrobotrys megalospora]
MDIRTRNSVSTVVRLLSTKVPVELALDIIDIADYHPYTILSSREEMDHVGAYRSKTYLTVNIPYFGTRNNVDERNPERQIVRKIVFRTTSHDQGWGGQMGCQGKYKGAFSWLGAEIWRKKTGNYKKDMKTALDSQVKIIEANGGDRNDPSAYHHWYMHHGYTKMGEEEEGGRGDDYKVGTWVLPRNICAKGENTDHEIIWDARIDGPGPDAERWELDCGYKDEDGRPMDLGWLKNGRLDNGVFVRELREGDEVRVTMRAYFGGWSCTVEKCEIECWWA